MSITKYRFFFILCILWAPYAKTQAQTSSQQDFSCENLDEMGCYDVYEPTMCVISGGDGRWFAASNKCLVTKQVIRWSCQEDQEIPWDFIICYSANTESPSTLEPPAAQVTR